MELNRPNCESLQKLSMIHNQTHVCEIQQLMSKTSQPWSGHEGAGKTLFTMGTTVNLNYVTQVRATSLAHFTVFLHAVQGCLHHLHGTRTDDYHQCGLKSFRSSFFESFSYYYVFTNFSFKVLIEVLVEASHE